MTSAFLSRTILIKHHRLTLNTSNVLQFWQQGPQDWFILRGSEKRGSGSLSPWLVDSCLLPMSLLIVCPWCVPISSFPRIKTHVLLGYSLLSRISFNLTASLVDSVFQQLFSGVLKVRAPTYEVLERPKLSHNNVDLTFLRSWEHSWPFVREHALHNEQPSSLALGR